MSDTAKLTLEEALEAVYSGYTVQSPSGKYTLYKLGGVMPADRVLYEVLGQVDGNNIYEKMIVDISENDKLVILHNIYQGAFVLPGSLARKILRDEVEGWKLLKDDK